MTMLVLVQVSHATLLSGDTRTSLGVDFESSGCGHSILRALQQATASAVCFSFISKMFPALPSSGAFPPSLQMLPPVPSVPSSFWQGEHVGDHLRNLEDTIDLLKAVQKELDMILLIKRSNGFREEENKISPAHLPENISVSSSEASILGDVFQTKRDNLALMRMFSNVIKEKRIHPDVQESLSLEAACSLLSALKNKLAPLNAFSSQTGSWEERSMAIKLANKLQKLKRNKHWKKKRRKHVAEMLCKLELVLIVEKLQELRSIRIQKMKKQGHFLPEEDDKFLERVRAAVEEEERQAAAAADTDAAKDAIATAESRKTTQSSGADARDVSIKKDEATVNQDCITDIEKESSSIAAAHHEGHGSGGGYDTLANLPVEFYHYYHGSNTDMGTLIEVRRTWDAYIRPGGSRIPGHWIQPPPPADDVWASYLVRPR
ncbi:hypothetical protein MRB53_022620 [Persea americana]|uniref:Uncharacterized protein n=1 Tax=Persea americana TaxID=3435 RepID=A0ACC2L853_PERAE|nr:hypothetical protein MRB53_022620 [Persea americana]